MRQDWVEFEGKAIGKIIVRPECISWISQDGIGDGKSYVAIHIDDGSYTGTEMGINEPYEQVKQKIMDAERVDLSNVVVEHFTKDEYERLLALAMGELEGCKQDNIPDQVLFMQKIVDKLNEIIKEDK